MSKTTYERVKEWNIKVNKFPEPIGTAAYYNSLEKQFNLIYEELNELYDAIQTKNITEIVDAGLDLDVVVSGLNFLSGSDYINGIDLVLKNNDLKYHTEKEYVEQWKFYWDANGVETEIQESEYEDVTYYSLHRLEDNKIMKFANFPSVDLSSVVPEAVTEKFVLVDGEATDLANQSGLPVLQLSDMEDESGVLQNILGQYDNNELVLTILNGSLVNVEQL